MSINQLSTEQSCWLDMFDASCLNVNHKLAALLKAKQVQNRDLRSNRKFKNHCEKEKKNRFKKSFIVSQCNERNFNIYIFGAFLIYYKYYCI